MATLDEKNYTKPSAAKVKDIKKDWLIEVGGIWHRVFNISTPEIDYINLRLERLLASPNISRPVRLLVHQDVFLDVRKPIRVDHRIEPLGKLRIGDRVANFGKVTEIEVRQEPIESQGHYNYNVYGPGPLQLKVWFDNGLTIQGEANLGTLNVYREVAG